jgi:hypothetical protein
MPLIIPIDAPADTVDDFRVTAALDGRSYVLDFSWSHRAESWYLDVRAIGSAPGELIDVCVGQRISCWYPPMAGTPDGVRPPGEIVPWDLTNAGTDPAHNELGDRVVIAYETAAELGRP